jgi:transporter family protein
MNWFAWALLSAGFAGLTAILAKIGVKDVDSNLATAIRTSVILSFAWLVAAGANLWVGVARAGYSVADEAPVFLLVFAVPAGVALLAGWWVSRG